jgi:dephospho-CoA kinase
MKIIGLTGGIGSGKSTVAGFLREFGAATIDADRLGHEALARGGPAYRQVASAFGADILAADGGIDRAALAQIVFNDPAALERLNRITHPAIDAMLEERLEEFRRQGKPAAVVEAAAMLEAGRTDGFDELWVTVAPEDVVLQRIAGRGVMTGDEARARIRAQLSNEARAAHADVVIDTDCSLEELREKVRGLWKKAGGTRD